MDRQRFNETGRNRALSANEGPPSISEMKKHKLFLAVTALAAAITALPAKAADEPTPRIMVSGEGEAWAAPDMAVVNLTVLREAPTSRESLDANNKAMSEVMAAMKAFGIEDKDLQTSGFSIQPRYQYPDPNRNETFEPKIIGYTVVNTLGVRIRDLAKVGEILDQSVTLGVNQGVISLSEGMTARR